MRTPECSSSLKQCGRTCVRRSLSESAEGTGFDPEQSRHARAKSRERRFRCCIGRHQREVFGTGVKILVARDYLGSHRHARMRLPVVNRTRSASLEPQLKRVCYNDGHEEKKYPAFPRYWDHSSGLSAISYIPHFTILQRKELTCGSRDF